MALSAQAYEVMQERLQLGPMHAAVAIDYPWRPPDEAHELARRTGFELRDRGLLDGNQPTEELVDALYALAKPVVACGVVLHAADDSERLYVVAASDSSAWFAELVGEELVLQPVPPDRVIETAVGCLPPAPPGRGRPLVIRRDSIDDEGRPSVHHLDNGENSPTALATELRDADAVARMLRAPRQGAGQISWQYRENGELVFAAQPVVFLDLPDGRWATTQHHDSSGVEWLTATPATAQTLVHAVQAQR